MSAPLPANASKTRVGRKRPPIAAFGLEHDGTMKAKPKRRCGAVGNWFPPKTTYARLLRLVQLLRLGASQICSATVAVTSATPWATSSVKVRREVVARSACRAEGVEQSGEGVDWMRCLCFCLFNDIFDESGFDVAQQSLLFDEQMSGTWMCLNDI